MNALRHFLGISQFGAFGFFYRFTYEEPGDWRKNLYCSPNHTSNWRTLRLRTLMLCAVTWQWEIGGLFHLFFVVSVNINTGLFHLPIMFAIINFR